MDEVWREKVLKSIEQELGISAAAIELDQNLRESAILDSMQFVGLLARVELALDIEMPIAVMEVKTLREFLLAVKEELLSQGKVAD